MVESTNVEYRELPPCELVIQPGHTKFKGMNQWYWCTACGRFVLDRRAEADLRELSPAKLALLRGVIREKTNAILRSDFDSENDVLLRTAEDIDRLIELAPQTVHEKGDRFLAEAVRQTKYFGEVLGSGLARDLPLAFAQNYNEVCALLQLLDELGYVRFDDNPPETFVVTGKGFEHDRLRHTSNAQSEFAFVAMYFSEEMNTVYSDAIAPAIEAAGYSPKRVDLEEHNDDVIDRMLGMIREARFVVADFTGHRNGVYFEAGFGIGLGLPVVWCCKADEMKGSHFDTNHFSHVTWKSAEELKSKLEARILATIGRGPLSAKLPR